MSEIQPCFFLRLASTKAAQDSRKVLVRLLETNNFVVTSPSPSSPLLLLSVLHSHTSSPHLQCFDTEQALVELPANAHLFPVRAPTAPNLLLFVQRAGLVTECGPLHLSGPRRKVWADAWRSLWTLPTPALRAYFGEEVAYYFEWMNFYSAWLLLPGLLSLLLWIHSSLIVRASASPSAGAALVDRNPWVPFYTFFLVVWAFLFNKLWRRKSNSLAFQWSTWRDGLAEFAPARHALRPSFHGEPRRSPITGEMELHYPAWRRRYKYLASAAVTGVMLVVAFVLMICSLNLQGYVDERTRFGDENPFYFGALQKLSRPGAVFDSGGPWYRSMVPAVIHSAVILVLNQLVYKNIAEWLTEWENHKTEEKFHNSLIIKRFLFDAFDCYVALFYLAFYECDVDELRSALVSLYTTDSVRRILVESVLPLMLYLLRGGREEMDRYMTALRMRKRSRTGEADLKAAESAEAVRDLREEPYEIFDDYLEMVIQFGYTTLFASAFPLAACLSIATNWLEVRSDAFKLTHVCRRPSVRRVHGIGMWRQIVQAITWLSVITNVFIFSFSSEQMMQWFPWLYEHVTVSGADGRTMIEQELRTGAGRYVLGLIFVLEHVLIVIGLSIEAAIDDIPMGTKNKLMAAEYQKAKLLEERERASSASQPPAQR